MSSLKTCGSQGVDKVSVQESKVKFKHFGYNSSSFSANSIL